ncbi:MAG: isopeptide-forming domain-containing fimbrial protein [Butyrivibrio sp.]|nr:isopeptide-forming domain-containing fimbrial protein [Butyrivibrio sp.]MBR1641410.1 isopeptide-forming domain-containing fimbrial protein [Butyrivibrio sp.]
MKGLKKLLTGILAATLIMGSSLTVYAGEDTNTDPAPAAAAADTSATITITPKATTVNEVKKGTVESITYTYYQVLRATAPEGKVEADTAISYYLDQSTDGAMKALLAGDDGIFDATDTADGSKWIMTIKKKADGTAYTGEDVRDFLNKQEIKDAALNAGTPNTFAYDSSTGKAKSGTLPIGYYLIESSLGSVVALDTVGHVDIEEKNDYITTTKTVSKYTYNVGDDVEYKATVFIPTSTKVGSDVILHDKMEAGKLQYNNDASAKIGENAFGGFTVVVATEEKPFEDGCTFEITIPVDANLLGKTIEFKYTAEVTSEAADADGFVNELFGENNGYKTTPDQPRVFTYGFNVDKKFVGYEDNGEENFTAKFEIRTAATDASTAIKFVQVGDALNYRKAREGEEGATTDVIVNKNDISNFYGLDEGTYYLVEKETDAPGYNILTTPVAVTITAVRENNKPTAEWTVSVGEVVATDKTVIVTNTKGTMLPSTGGIGTTIFYIIGGLLIVAGVAYFIVRRKANAE